MSFNCNSLYYVDGYKLSHKEMLAPGTTKLYGTWIPRSLKHALKGIDKIVSFGQQLVWKWIHDEFEENFFYTEKRKNLENPNSSTFQNALNMGELLELKNKALSFSKDMLLYLGMDFNGEHFEKLWDLGYLPIKVKALPEGIETNPNIPHMTFVNTVDGFAWLTLYLETIVSSLAWKPSTSATIARLYRKQAEEWVKKTDPDNLLLVDYMCHDFSARGLNPHDMISSGLGHATSFRGSDTLSVIPAARYFYGVKDDEMPIFSVVAGEHSVTTSNIFAAKGAWFEVEEEFWASPESLEPGIRTKSYNIYKDPVTDDGVKRSLKGLLQVKLIDNEYVVNQECSWEQEENSELRIIYEDGKFYNETSLTEIRKKLNEH